MSTRAWCPRAGRLGRSRRGGPRRAVGMWQRRLRRPATPRAPARGERKIGKQGALHFCPCVLCTPGAIPRKLKAVRQKRCRCGSADPPANGQARIPVRFAGGGLAHADKNVGAPNETVEARTDNLGCPQLATARYLTSSKPTSMNWPPPVWWQWTARRFWPGLRAALPAGVSGRSSYSVV